MSSKYPDSAELKKLKKQIKDSSDLYLELSAQIVEMERERIQIEKEMKSFNHKLHKVACEARHKKCKADAKKHKK